MTKIKPYTWLLPLLVVAGCSNSGSAPTPTDSAQAQAAKPAPAARRVIGRQQQDDAAAQAEMEQALADSAKKAEATTQQPPVEQPAANRDVADVGAGKKGRGYERGLITTPISSYFAGREQITFHINVPRAIKEFKAINNRGIKSTEEFMKWFKEYGDELPELPEGDRYVYDPKAEELMVEHPK